jgi:hypothetical protein
MAMAGTKRSGSGKGATTRKTTATSKKKTTRKKASSRKKHSTRKYGPLAAKKVRRNVEEMKRHKLRSGRSGKKVTSRKQAIAIGLSEARGSGGKVPKKK